MGRILQRIEIEGQPTVAFFDTGAVYTYVRSDLVRQAPCSTVSRPVRVALGGRTIEITELCLFNGKIEGLDFFTDAVPVDRLGVAEGQELGAVIGARTMEQWQIRLDPATGALDLEGLRQREFTEF